MATSTNEPDSNTFADDTQDAPNQGVSTPEPAEGGDGAPGPQPGSPQPGSAQG